MEYSTNFYIVDNRKVDKRKYVGRLHIQVSDSTPDPDIDRISHMIERKCGKESIDAWREEKKPEHFHDYAESCIEEMENRIKEMDKEERTTMFDNDEPHDMISEIADSNTPIYTDTIFEVMASDSRCWEIDDSGLIEGVTDMVKLAQIHIYHALESEMWEKWRELKEEYDNDKE